MRADSYKKFFLFCGLYNLINGLLAIAFFKIVFKMAYNISYNKQIHEFALLNHILLFGFVAIVGVGLITASRNPANNKAIILVSALGKFFAFFTWILSYYKGLGTMLLIIGGSIDALMASIFIMYLVQAADQ